MLAWPWLCCSGQRRVCHQLWDPLMAEDMIWELLRCWGRDCQGETAGEGSFISSTAAGRREMLSLFLISPVLWELGSPLPTSPIPGGVHPGMERLSMAR